MSESYWASLFSCKEGFVLPILQRWLCSVKAVAKETLMFALSTSWGQGYNLCVMLVDTSSPAAHLSPGTQHISWHIRGQKIVGGDNDNAKDSYV